MRKKVIEDDEERVDDFKPIVLWWSIGYVTLARIICSRPANVVQCIFPE